MSREGGKRRAYSYEDDGRSRKRRRTSEAIDIEDRLESLITRVGEKSSSSLESNLEALANVLEADLPNFKERILKIICTCASNLPEKTSVYSTLVGLLNARNYNVGEEFLDIIMDNLRDVLGNNNFDRARLLVRFVSDLVNCKIIIPSSLLALYDSLVSVTMDTNSPQVRSDWYIYTVLSALPWSGKELADKRNSEFERLLGNIENYIGKRSKIHAPALRVWSSDDPHPQEEYLDCLWSQIKKMKQDSWQEKHIRRPYLGFDSVLCDALQHPLPSLTIQPYKEGVSYPLPQVIFRMFDYTDVGDGPPMPGLHAIERFLVEESLARIVSSHYKDRKECANQLVAFPGKSKIPLNYCIVEVIFSYLFRMPAPPHLEIFYGSLLIELCKLQINSMPVVLAQTTEMLFERLETMNATCIERFTNWFSYHLANFQYKWTWDDWASVAELAVEHPKSRFVREVFDKCKRFSYQQFVIDSVAPESLHSLVPPEPMANYRFTEDNSGIPGYDGAMQLIDAIKAKKDIDELLGIINEIPATAGGGGDEDEGQSFPSLRIEVFVQVLLKLGTKTITHAFSALVKFHKIFKALCKNDNARLHLLKAMHEFCDTHNQLFVILVDKMVRMQLVDCANVVNFLFCREMAPHFTKHYVWECMSSTVKKMMKHTTKVQQEMTEAQERLQRVETKAKRATEPKTEDGKEDESAPKTAVDSSTLAEIDKKQKEVEELNDKLENAQREQKQLFLIVFQRFILILTDHLVNCEQQQLDFNTSWFKYTTDRLKEIFLVYHNEVYQYINTLESLQFTPELDSHILEIFNQFKALKS